jgi:two-component system chemotaxis response regulator CheB
MNPRPTCVLQPGQRIRVLVVDDSVVTCRLVVRALEEDPEFEVAGVAANGVIALALIPQVHPDAVTLDIEMPEMNGLETLRRLRQEYPALRVVMFSALTERGAAATFDALGSGADDYLPKISGAGSPDVALQGLKRELLPKIRQFFSLGASAAPLVAPAAASTGRVAGDVRPAARAEAVVIGISTGGPSVLAAMVPRIPADFPLPILIVQHMPPLFTRFLAERLDGVTKLSVREAAHEDQVESGRIYIAPGDYHMRVRRNGKGVGIALYQDAPQNSCRPAADALFSSAAEVYGPAAVGVVLTGMGHDGLAGARRLKAQGAPVLVQDQATSVVWGMPGAVAAAGLADEIVPLEGMVAAILRRAGL